MKNVIKQSTKTPVSVGKQYSYNEIVELLDKSWSATRDESLQCIKKLDQALGNVSQSLNTVLVAGTNGKSLTLHFITKLLREEGLSVGAFYSPHILNYNERFALNNETIANKQFTDLANEVLNTAAQLNLTPHATDILTMMALMYFKQANVDIAVLEVAENKTLDPVSICNPKIVAITRITEQEITSWAKNLDDASKRTLAIVKSGTHVVSADQSKLNLQVMQTIVEQMGGIWAMPIRKLAPLTYPFEQLHGRCAAIAERVAQIYINECLQQHSVMADSSSSISLLTKQKGQRGRPTLEAKRLSELNPKKTIEQFWKDTTTTLPGRFQLLDKEKPTILLDNAANLDALNNVLLGIRLLHYQRPLKGLTLILGCDNPHLDVTELLKLLRYFFKKNSGQIMICPVESLPGTPDAASWNIEGIINDIKSMNMKIKARSCKNFKEAFEAAQKTVDERHGLLVITGSPAIVGEYWRYKGMKKI